MQLLPIPMREPTLRDGNSSRPRSWRLGELRGGARLNEELPQEPVAVLGLTSWGISVDTGTAAAE